MKTRTAPKTPPHENIPFVIKIRNKSDKKLLSVPIMNPHPKDEIHKKVKYKVGPESENISYDQLQATLKIAAINAGRIEIYTNILEQRLSPIIYKAWDDDGSEASAPFYSNDIKNDKVIFNFRADIYEKSDLLLDFLLPNAQVIVYVYPIPKTEMPSKPTTHELKILPEHFNAHVKGNKPWEVRINDRDFKKGDHIILREWDDINKKYTGKEVARKISYILTGKAMIAFGFISPNYCIMSLEKIPKI